MLEYLGAVCDAENAIYACNEAIASLEKQVEKIPPVGYPPCLYEPDMEFRYNVWYLEDEPKRGDYLFPWQYKKALNEFLMGRRLAEQELAEYEKKKLEIKQWYEKEMPIYNRKVQINLKTDRLLKQEIEKCSSLRS